MREINFCKTIALFALATLFYSCGGNADAVQDEQKKDNNPAPEVEPDTTVWPLQEGYYVLNWPDLAIPDYREEYNEEIQQEVSIPLFRDAVKKLDGQLVRIMGFFIPLDENPEEVFYVLSQFPNSQCFFCGAAGPDSVMDLLPASKLTNIKMDDHVTFQGRLRLNDEDVMFLNYILEEAELVK
ncbi:MAG: hypothetical protein KF852_02605 [Saprospiraceae bacterium]|nr:hypothetical protein [Saprospiraceae bacterium]